MSGRFCEKHQEWAPEGRCRWCEPEVAVPVLPLVEALTKPNPLLQDVPWRATVTSCTCGSAGLASSESEYEINGKRHKRVGPCEVVTKETEYAHLVRGMAYEWTGTGMAHIRAAMDLAWSRMTDEQKRAEPNVMEHHYKELKANGLV